MEEHALRRAAADSGGGVRDRAADSGGNAGSELRGLQHRGLHQGGSYYAAEQPAGREGGGRSAVAAPDVSVPRGGQRDDHACAADGAPAGAGEADGAAADEHGRGRERGEKA